MRGEEETRRRRPRESVSGSDTLGMRQIEDSRARERNTSRHALPCPAFRRPCVSADSRPSLTDLVVVAVSRVEEALHVNHVVAVEGLRTVGGETHRTAKRERADENNNKTNQMS